MRDQADFNSELLIKTRFIAISLSRDNKFLNSKLFSKVVENTS